MERQEATTFGSLFRKLRVGQGKSLREFCLEHGFDPGNISKMERGIIPPPKPGPKTDEYARALGLVESSADWYEFNDLAATEAGRIPAHIRQDKELLAKLPAVFRTLRKDRPTEEQLDALVELLRRD